MRSKSEETREWYQRYYREKGADRNDLLNNPEVMFQHLAGERSVLQALRATGIADRTTARVLDVGCGSGGSLLRFLGLGFSPANLLGVDIIPDRIVEARARLPGISFEAADATALPFADGSFDIVFESTMFVQITDESMAGEIAAEMLRVTRPGGHVMLIDWRYSKPGNPNYLGVSPARIKRLFDLPARGNVVYSCRGSLVPPVGRFLSKYLPALYFPVAAALPFLAGQNTTLVRKN